MAISIECDACRSNYRVDDKLAGKRVKCKSCGRPILVPDANAPFELVAKEPEPEPMGFRAAQETAFPGTIAPPPPAPVKPRPSETVAGNDCLSCGAAMPPGARVCVACGFNSETGRKEAGAANNILDLTEVEATRRKRRWVRSPGSPLLESLDELIKIVLLLAAVGALIVGVVHIHKSPAGLSSATLTPLAVVLAALAAFMAPLLTICINSTVRALRMAPREDTYSRVVTVLLLPFITSLYAGWPDTVNQWGGLVTLSWFAAPILLAYFFRAEALEWAASVLVGAAAAGIGCLMLNLLTGPIAMVTGQLYADMLPGGPWKGLANGHSPAVQIATTQPAATIPNSAEANAASPPPEVINNTSPPLFSANGNAPAEAAAASGTPAKVAVVDTPPTPAPPAKIASPFLAAVTDEDDLHDVQAIFATPSLADALLVLKHDDRQAGVERWGLDPLAKADEFTYPLLPAKMPVAAISPRGDNLVTLVYFPTSQLEIASLDKKNRTAKKVVALGQPDLTPAFLGFIDYTHLFLRWDSGGQTKLQEWSTNPVSQVRVISLEPVAAEVGSVVISSAASASGTHWIAALGANHSLTLYSTESGKMVRRMPTSNVPLKLIDLAFSPDSTKIALYATLEDVPTVLTYQVQNGELLSTTVMSGTPRTKDSPPLPAHALLWLPSGKTWLVDGNELVDAESGKILGTLGIPGLMDEELIGPDKAAFLIRDPSKATRVVTATLEESRIRNISAEASK